jgi:hypothetical protein
VCSVLDLDPVLCSSAAMFGFRHHEQQPPVFVFDWR